MIRTQEEIVAFYNAFDEGKRLASGETVLEFARMKEIIGRVLDPAPSVVLDVGGGPGAYSFWLASKGYEVHLVDPVVKYIEEAAIISRNRTKKLASATVGDARSLNRADSSVDVVLLMGPLYHLPERSGRLQALSEALRVLRPGGILVVKAINRYATLFNCLRSGLLEDPYFVDMVERDVKTGLHLNPRGDMEYFTTAFLSHPDELKKEMIAAEFVVTDLIAVQGPGLLTKDFTIHWADIKRRRQILKFIRMVQREPTLLGLSRHFAIVGQKPIA